MRCRVGSKRDVRPRSIKQPNAYRRETEGIDACGAQRGEAYLSAYSTGASLVTQLLDEGIHLMGGCQTAGFQNVIGALWKVSDTFCVQIATDVYARSVSLTLYMAVLRGRGGNSGRLGELSSSRDVVPDEDESPESKCTVENPMLWVAYIHMDLKLYGKLSEYQNLRPLFVEYHTSCRISWEKRSAGRRRVRTPAN